MQGLREFNIAIIESWNINQKPIFRQVCMCMWMHNKSLKQPLNFMQPSLCNAYTTQGAYMPNDGFHLINNQLMHVSTDIYQECRTHCSLA